MSTRATTRTTMSTVTLPPPRPRPQPSARGGDYAGRGARVKERAGPHGRLLSGDPRPAPRAAPDPARAPPPSPWPVRRSRGRARVVPAGAALPHAGDAARHAPLPPGAGGHGPRG